MERRFLMVGNPTSQNYQVQLQLLKQRNCDSFVVAHLEPGITAAQLEQKVRAKEVEQVICIETQNGQTCYWALHLHRSMNGSSPAVFGINIPEHPQKVSSKGLEHVHMIESVKEII